MTKTKSTKRALLMSALTLLMCVSMLIGSTFAWFTDSVTSAGNIIKSGNLKVDLVDVNGNSMEGKVIDFVTADGRDQSEILWEPGCTYEMEPVYVVNKGNLALKYNFVINGIVGDAKLLEAIEWTITLDGVETDMYTYEGKLLPEEGKNKSGALVISGHMKKEAGNEYQDLTVEGISVAVYATQLASEYDSFNNQYDKDANYYDVLVSTSEELEAAITEGKKIIGIKGTAVELAAERAGRNRDMNGVTLVGTTDDATLTVTGIGGGLDNINLKNIKVVDSTFYTSENGENAWEFTYLELGGKNTFVNVAFDDGIMSDGLMSTFVDCTFSGHNNDSSTHGNTTMYGAWVYNGKATFTGCYFSGTRGLKVCDQYAGEVSNVVVDNCVFGALSEKPGLAIDDREESSFNIVIKNSYFIDCQAGDQNKYIYETDNYVPVLESNTVVADGTVVASADTLKAVTNGENVFLATDVEHVNTDANNQMFIKTTGALNFNGIGNTISVSGSNPSEGNHNYVSFLPPVGASATIENVTVTGEGFVEVGDYSYGAKNYTGEYTINNLVVKDLVATLAVNNKGFTLAAGFCHYGKAVLNDCVMTGTTNMVDGAMPVDATFVNSTTTLVNRGEYGVAYCYEHTNVTFDDAKIGTLYVSPIKGNVTVKAGTEIEKLVVDYGTSAPNVTKARLQNLVIEDGATINEIVYAGNAYTVDTWNAFVATFGA